MEKVCKKVGNELNMVIDMKNNIKTTRIISKELEKVENEETNNGSS